MRKRIYEIIEQSKGNDKLSSAYDFIMIAAIIISLIPLLFKEETALFVVFDKVTVVIFIVDYILRLITADYKYGKHKASSFIKYPFSFMAIIDLLSILPSLTLLNKGFKMLRLLRLLRAARVMRVFRLLRYSKSMRILKRVVHTSKEPLIAVCIFAGLYVVICALIVFNVEPDTFDNFFEALYWAVVSLTTVGYGDVYPVSTAGRIVTMISSIFGIALVALPAGIITAGYMNAIKEEDEKKK